MDSASVESVTYWLSQLRPNHTLLPPNTPLVSAFPWAHYLLLVILCIFFFILLSVIYWCFLHHYKNKKKYKSLLYTLKAIERAYKRHRNVDLLIADYNAFIKKVSIHYWPQEHTTTLNSRDWLVFLDNKTQSTQFTQGEGQHLGKYYHKPVTPLTPVKIAALSRCVKDFLSIAIAQRGP